MTCFEIIIAIVNIIAVIVAPIVAVKVGQYLQDRAQLRKDKMDIFRTLMANRTGWSAAKNTVEGTGGSFSFYDLGKPLLIEDNLNEAVGTEKIREYVWYMETRKPYAPPADNSPYYLGSANDTAYYFYYKPQNITVLDYEFLSGLTQRQGETVIYADRCSISSDKLKALGITFKKIPRDISRL